MDRRTSTAAETDPPYPYPDYKSTRLRAPEKPLVILPRTLLENQRPGVRPFRGRPTDHDRTRRHAGETLGERIVDGNGRPVRDSLLEVW